MVLQQELERNVRLLPWLAFFRSLLAWIPVYFLFFSKHLPLEEVLLLEAIYYFSNVILEVPSGSFSDRFGRRRSLLVAMVAQTGGCILIASTSSFAFFAVGLVGYPEGGQVRMVPWAGEVLASQRHVSHREPPESRLMVEEFVPCEQLVAQLDDARIERALQAAIAEDAPIEAE